MTGVYTRYEPNPLELQRASSSASEVLSLDAFLHPFGGLNSSILVAQADGCF